MILIFFGVQSSKPVVGGCVAQCHIYHLSIPPAKTYPSCAELYKDKMKCLQLSITQKSHLVCSRHTCNISNVFSNTANFTHIRWHILATTVEIWVQSHVVTLSNKSILKHKLLRSIAVKADQNRVRNLPFAAFLSSKAVTQHGKL